MLIEYVKCGTEDTVSIKIAIPVNRIFYFPKKKISKKVQVLMTLTRTTKQVSSVAPCKQLDS